MSITPAPITARTETVVHLHCPGDAPELEPVLEQFTASGIDLAVHRGDDSYMEWGEPVHTDPADDDTTHVVITVPTDYANGLYDSIAQAGVLVDATLPDDWASRITWGLGPEPDGWFTRYGHTFAF